MAYQPPPAYPGSSLRAKYISANNTDKSNKILSEIKQEYRNHGKYRMRQVEHKNILLIGRTRTGKSTIKSLLVDPTTVPNELTLKSGTREPHFQAFHLEEDDTVLNIIDTPGLFEHSNREVDIRDNEYILKTIGFCMNMEITKFHAICYCVSLTTGISAEDIHSLELLINYFGAESSKNSCLIITRCESIDEKHRRKLKKELMEDVYFKKIAPFFNLGIYFSGAISRDDLERGNESVYPQFFTINDYREELIELFLGVNEPIPIEKIAAGSSKFAQVYHNLPQRTHIRAENAYNRYK